MAVLVAALLSGCLGIPPSDGNSEFDWGLGLEIQRPYPAIGAFREPFAEIVFWDEVLDRITASNEENCTRTEGVGNLGQPYMIELELNFMVAFGCRMIPPGASTDELLTALQAQLERNRQEFATHASYPNITAVEIASTLMGLQLSIEHDMRIYMSLDEKGEVTDEGLIRTYGRMLGGAQVIERVLAEIPSGGNCGEPATDLANDTLAAYMTLVAHPPGRARLEATGALTEELEPAKGNIERLENAISAEFWPLYYRIASQLTYHQAYFELAENGTLTTHEEAVYLHALNANRMRAIKYDSHIVVDASGLEAPEFWERTPSWALRIMARGQQEWTYEQVSCSGS